MALGTVNVPGASGNDLESIRSTVNAANQTANEAKTIASAAKASAETANSNAAEAKTEAAAARSAADSANTAANEAVAAAGAASEAASAATAFAAAAQSAANAAQASADKAAEEMEKVNQAIEEGWGSLGGGGNTIEITFEAAFAGAEYTVTDGKENKSGTVPEGLAVSVRVNNCNSTYTIRAQASNGVEYSTSVVTGAFYGQYTALLAVFNAIINVTAAPGAVVRAAQGSNVFTATAGDDGIAAVRVNQEGAYTITATKDNAASDSAAVTVTAEETYTAAVRFIVLTVTSEPGATLSLVNGDTALTGSGTGTDVFYLPKTGTWTATLTSPEETSTKSIEITEYKDYTLKVMFVSDVLDENDWEKIRDVSDAGEGANYWKVGDTKSITINGTVGSFTFSNLKVDAFILGFNHNSAKEGSDRIHFQIGKISGKMVGLCDSKYGSNVSSTGYFNMNSSNTNVGGWKDSYMRKTLLGNSNTPGSPLANSLMAALPSDLRSNMKSVSKYTDNVGNSGGNVAANVTTTEDYLWLLSEFEVQGGRSYANSYEQNSQLQYDYYKAGNSKIAYNHSSTGTAVWWWLRSPYYNNGNNFCDVNTDGSSANNNAYYSAGVLPGFAV